MSFRVQSPAAAAELQNNATKIHFAILKAACQKSPRDFFDKLSSGAPAGFRFCHSEERSDVGISCNRLRFRRGLLVIQYGTARLPRPLRDLAMTIPEPCSVLTARAAARLRRCSFLPAYFPQLPQQLVPPQSLPSGWKARTGKSTRLNSSQGSSSQPSSSQHSRVGMQ